jgi:hypothetical protein
MMGDGGITNARDVLAVFVRVCGVGAFGHNNSSV